MMYKIDFTCGVRGHHIHKTNWTLMLNEKLDCKKDNRKEALYAMISIQSESIEKMEPSLVIYLLNSLVS